MRTPSTQNAATTPYRRSMADLMEQLNDLFDSLPTSTSSSRPQSPLVPLSQDAPAPLQSLQPRTVPIRLLPDLFAAFEHKRGVEILSKEERDQFGAFVASLSPGTEEQPVGVEDVLKVLVQMGVSGSDTPRQQESTSRESLDSMLPVESDSRPADGSPFSSRHRRTLSAASTSSARSITPSSPSARPSTPLARTSLIPTASPASRRRSLMSNLSRQSSLESPRNSEGGRTLRKKRTFEDLSNMIIQQGGKYLGVGLDGPTGDDWEAGELSLKVRAVLSAKGPNRDRDLGALLTPLTHPQLKSLNESYSSHFGKPLLDVLAQDKSFKGTVEFIVQGLLVGPLAWDVHLLQLALDGDKVNDTLLIDLLVGRSPSSLALLHAAYSHRSTLRSLNALTPTSASTGSPAQTSNTSRSLNVAVLSAFSSGQLRLRKAWECALQGRWNDQTSSSDSSDEETRPSNEPLDEERRRKLVREDLDQLKVALRRGGNTELVSKILLARSPHHLSDLDQEYRKSTAGHSSLSKAIKQSVGPGTLQRMLLHAVGGGKKKLRKDEGGMEQEVTIWRDVKKLGKVVERLRAAEDVKGKDKETIKQDCRDELAWRLSRLHWDRPRFSAIQEAYKQKYRQTLVSHVDEITTPSSALREIMTNLVDSALLPEPIASAEDRQRLERPPSRVRTISTDSVTSTSSERLSTEEASPFPSSESEQELEAVKIKGYESGHSNRMSGSEVEAGELEAQGEMSDPPSPRSPPPPSLNDDELDFAMDDQDQDDNTPNVSSMSTLESQSDLSTLSETNESSSLPRSTSALSFTSQEGSPSRASSKQRRPSSSLSNRSRPGGLPNLHTHRPPSSASGSVGDRSISSLRHSRPIAPSRAKRRQSGEASNRERSASTEPLSPTDSHHQFAARSPTPSGRSRSSLGRSTSTGSISLSTSQDSLAVFGSPGVDETSFHPAPLSPVGDVGPSSSSFASAFPGLSPAPASPPPFDLSGSSDIFGTVGDSPGFGTRRHSSTDSAGNPRPSSGIFAATHSRDGSLMNSEQVQQLVQSVADLQRKLKDAEGRLQASASAFEQDQSDLEARLEEVRAELQSKRREEKELRNNEKQHLGQISSLEGDIAKLTKSLERSRENYDSMKRNYTESCEEAERLRALVAETRRENRAAEESIQGHALQVQQFERDRELLQQGINKLEEDLEDARKAQDTLDDQKQENLVLKETIDRLRFDLDEMRTANRKSGFLDPTGESSSPGKTLQASISRSLGRELATHLQDEEESDSEETEEEGEGEDEIIVTTQRRIKKRSKKNGPLSEPLVQHLETTVNVCDVDVQTERLSTRPIEVQTDLSGVGVDLIVAPKRKTAKERKEEAAKELGVDIELVKQYLESQKPASQRIVELSAPASPRRNAIGGRWRSRMLPGSMVQAPSLLISYFPTAARPYVGQILDSGITLMLYSATIFLFGILTGARLLPVNHYHYLTPFSGVLPFSDAGAYSAMSTWEGLIPGAAGNAGLAREGIAQFFYELVWNGVQNARRIPV
ncbi:uncharacterized protein JCM6883_006909 [Sporobolomyces salmoneus]|uniref:uncharacterized protein n=1 Tax=Sporobolomyces salmoneus TaxID=183962 RepID=UPI00316D100D